jgi:hypothetical protein
MTEEDEEFNRIEREAALRTAAVKATITKREWVSLTREEVDEIYCDTELFVGNAWEGLAEGEVGPMFSITLYERFEAKWKEKNEM